MANPKPPLYVLPHGVEVVAEYAVGPGNPYARLRIRPHHFFPDARVVSNGCEIRKSRVLLAVKLGRALRPDEVAHHVNEDKTDDRIENLELETAATHNTHHKTGSTRTDESRLKTADSLRASYAAGNRKRPTITQRNQKGQIVCTR